MEKHNKKYEGKKQPLSPIPNLRFLIEICQLLHYIGLQGLDRDVEQTLETYKGNKKCLTFTKMLSMLV